MLIQGILTSYLGMSLGKRHHLHLGEQNALSELLVINNHLPSQYQSYCAFEYQSFVVPATQNTSPFVSQQHRTPVPLCPSNIEHQSLCVPATQNTSPFVSQQHRTPVPLCPSNTEHPSLCVPATQNTSPFVSPDLDQSSCQDKQLGLNMGREKTITNQTNTGTVTNATLGKCLRDGVERTYGSFQSRRCGLELK